MKRHLIPALIIGLIVGGLLMGLHVYGWLLRPEMLLTDLFSKDGSATKFVPDRWQYVIVFALAIVLAFFFGYSLTMAPVLRSGLTLRRAVQVALAADTISIAIMELIDNGFMYTTDGWGTVATQLETLPSTPSARS